ncbi:uncharacterized protein LOC113461159 [Phoenix dactylifera]|uniref:Uncharacterized protein LOC113461159 n=1 Tax=Phoenix dactylifera TaxID=42345 RepID=A0A8B8IZI6_PHODC|nr:uncharacterized protein LOC113461159 [Phoenix dactylifera]
MNIPGLVLPASLFQQTEQQQSLKCNDLSTKCSSVGDMSRPLGNAIKEASRGGKSQENLTDIGSLKQSSDDLGELCRHSSDGNKSAGLASNSSNSSNMDEPMKKISKKKKKRKGKLNKKQFQNNVASKTDLASLTSTTTQLGPEESSSMTGPIECNQHNEGVCYQSSKEVIDCYVHNGVTSKCDNGCSESTPDPEGSLHVSKTDDIECLSRSNRETPKVVVLQDSTSDFCKVDNVNSTELVRKQDKDATFPGSVVISATGWETVDSCLKDAGNCEEKSFSNAHYQEICGVNGSQILPEDTGCRSMEASENKSDATTFGTKRSNTSQDKVNADFSDIRNERNIKSPPMRSQSVNHLAHCISSMKMSMAVQEFSKDGGIEENNSCNQYFKVSDNPAIVTNQGVEHDEGQAPTLIYASRLPSQINNHKHIGKENAYFIWQKTRKNIGSIQTRGRKRSNCYQMGMDKDTAGRTSLSKHNSFAGDGLLPCPQSSYTDRAGFQQRAKKLGICDQERCITRGQVLIESPKWTFPQSLNVGCGQNVSISGDGSMGSMAWEKLKDKLNQPFKQENAIPYRRGFWVSKANYCKSQTKMNIACRDLLEIPRTVSLHRSNIAGERSSRGNHHHKFDFSEAHEFVPSFPAFSSNGQLHGPWTRTSSHQKLLHEIQPNAATEVPISEDALFECYQAFLDNENKSPACLEFELRYNNNSKGCISSGVSSQKWIPVGKKDQDPLMFKSSIVTDASNSKKIKFHQKTDIVAICDEASVTDVSKDMNDGLISGRQGRSLWEGKSDHNASGAYSKNSPIYIGSELTTQALDAAYRFQLASERVQLATGRPIAEFEKLLYSASPVIISSVRQYHEDNSRDQPIPDSFNKFQNIDVLLQDVWRWYERPGNYGLEVKAEEPQNSIGLETNVVSFHAHFVPYLSAVQLFVRSQHSSTGSSPGNRTSGVSQKGETEPCSLSSLSQNQLCPELAEQTLVSDLFSSRERHMKPFHLIKTDRDDSCNSLYASSSSDDSEVAFEYFEHEPPQQRKPFYTKVKELMEIGSSNPSVFGDPSKLGNMNLKDLHPASWFSVAWYPIYRIPEGSFRASFLTYHSLGHLVLRRIKLDSLENTAFCVVFPVLGMQSYNAQGECWFRPKKSAGSVLIDGTSFEISEILKERLRALEETSALFARGHVHKDQIRTPNRQPDYEFFLSRKQ